MNYLEFRLKDIPPDLQHDGVRFNGWPLHFAEQRTGYGVRKLFVCPSCGARRAKLVLTQGGIYCHGCAPFNVYRQRCNLYDNGGEKLITYHMQKLAASIGITIKWPFCYLDYLLDKPKGMRWSRWQQTMKRLQILEGMRNCAIFFGRRYTAADIKKRARSLEGYTLDYLWRYWVP